MKKFLLSLALVVGSLCANAEVVTISPDNWTGEWTKNGKNYEATFDGFKVVLDKASSSTDPVEPKTEMRVYQGSNLVITAPAGAKMTSVVFTVASSSKVASASDVSFSDGWTLKGTPSTSVNSTFGATSEGLESFTFEAGKQLRTKNIEITYTQGEAPKVATPVIACADNIVTITATDADAVYYTIDGTAPSNASTKYTAPFAITATTTVKAIAYKGADASSVATFTATYVGTFADFAAFVAANTTGTVEGPISVLYQSADKRNLFLKDSKGGFMLAYGSIEQVLVNGDVLASITGKYSPYNNLPELTSPAIGAVTKGAEVAPETVAIGSFTVEDANKYIKLVNVNITGVSGKNFTITDADGNTVAGYNNVSLAEIPEGEGFTIEGFVCRFKDNLQVTPVSITGGEVMETVEAPVFSVASGAVTAGTELTITCETEGAAIYYTLDGSTPSAESTKYTAAIVINEAMTINAIAVKAGMIDSPVASAIYTIIDENATVAVFDFTKPAELVPAVEKPATPSTGTDIDGMSFSNNAVTLKIGEAAGSAKPRLWLQTNGETEFRCYKGDSFTLSVPAEYLITAVDFTSAATDVMTFKSNYGDVTVDGKAAAWLAGDMWINDLVFSVPTDAAKTPRLNTITVTYSLKSNGVDEVAVDVAAPAEYYTLQGVRVANPAAGNIYIVRQGARTSKVLVK